MKAKKTCHTISEHTRKINEETYYWTYTRMSKYIVYAKVLFVPTFVFFKVYFFQLRMLKGWEGYYEAKSKAFQYFLNYSKYIEWLKMNQDKQEHK